MEIRLGPHNLADALPTLLRTVSTEHTKGTISDGEYHLFKDDLLSREIHAVKRINQQLLAAQAREAAAGHLLTLAITLWTAGGRLTHTGTDSPARWWQVVAKLAQLPRDPKQTAPLSAMWWCFC